MIRSISLNWEAWACTSCSSLRVLCEQNHTAVLKHIKTVHCLNGYFPQPALFASSSLNYLVQCLQCWLVLHSNRLQCFAPTHEPQNHQNREGNELRNPLRIPLRCGHRCRHCGFLHSPVRLK